MTDPYHEGWVLSTDPAQLDPYLPDRYTSLGAAVKAGHQVLKGETWLMGRGGDDEPAPELVWVCSLTREPMPSEDGMRFHVVYTVEPVCYLAHPDTLRALAEEAA